MQFKVNLLPVLVRPKLDYLWINIPKNASSFMQKILQDNGWREPDPSIVDSLLDSAIPKFCVFRNPIERWISGFAECFMELPGVMELLDNPVFIEILKRSPVFDNHTELQSAFIVDERNLSYISLGSSSNPRRFFFNVQEFIKNIGYQADCGTWNDPVNHHSNDLNKEAINSKLALLVNQNTSLSESLDMFFKSDYDLISRAQRKEYNG